LLAQKKWQSFEGLLSSLKNNRYFSTLASSTLIILFSKMLKFSKIISSKSKNIMKENSEYLKIFRLLE
jgi:hypothetical protein